MLALSSDKLLALRTHLKKFYRLNIQAVSLMTVENGSPKNSEDDVRPKVVSIVELLDRLHDLFSAQARILKHRQLMASGVRHHVVDDIIVFLEIGVELGPWIGVRHGNLNRFRVQFHGQLYGLLNRFFCLTGKPNLKITLHDDPQLFTVFHESPSLFNGRSLLDVL